MLVDDEGGSVDLVLFAGSRRPLDEPSEALAAARPVLEMVRIGDAGAPGTSLDAVAEGACARCGLEPPDG